MTAPKITQEQYNKHHEEGMKDYVIALNYGIKESSLSRSKRGWKEKALKDSRAKTVVKAQCIIEQAEKIEEKIPKLDKLIEQIEEHSIIALKKDALMKGYMFDTVINVCKAINEELSKGHIPNVQGLGVLLKAVKDD